MSTYRAEFSAQRARSIHPRLRLNGTALVATWWAVGSFGSVHAQPRAVHNESTRA
jgi:hypothetical protein